MRLKQPVKITVGRQDDTNTEQRKAGSKKGQSTSHPARLIRKSPYKGRVSQPSGTVVKRNSFGVKKTLDSKNKTEERPEAKKQGTSKPTQNPAPSSKASHSARQSGITNLGKENRNPKVERSKQPIVSANKLPSYGQQKIGQNPRVPRQVSHLQKPSTSQNRLKQSLQQDPAHKITHQTKEVSRLRQEERGLELKPRKLESKTPRRWRAAMETEFEELTGQLEAMKQATLVPQVYSHVPAKPDPVPQSATRQILQPIGNIPVINRNEAQSQKSKGLIPITQHQVDCKHYLQAKGISSS